MLILFSFAVVHFAFRALAKNERWGIRDISDPAGLPLIMVIFAVLGIITVNALVAATHVLIPIQSSYFALEGTDDLLETIEKVRSRPNPELDLLGVLVTLFDKRTALSKDVEAHIRKVFGAKAFKTIITRSVRLEESPAHKETIFSYAPNSSGASEYLKLSEEVLKRV